MVQPNWTIKVIHVFLNILLCLSQTLHSKSFEPNMLYQISLYSRGGGNISGFTHHVLFVTYKMSHSKMKVVTLTTHKSSQGISQRLTSFRLLSCLNELNFCGLFFNRIIFQVRVSFSKKKPCIQETLNLLTHKDSSTNTYFNLNFIYFFGGPILFQRKSNFFFIAV